MIRFIARRLLEMVGALIGLSLVVFLVLHVGHLNPARGLLGKLWTPKRGAALDAQLGLNKPMLIQFVLWLRGLILVGGLGQTIRQYLPPTMEVLLIGILLGSLAAIAIAKVQILHPHTLIDHLLNTAVGILSAVPGFFVGGLLLYLLSIKWIVFPATAMTPPGAGIFSWAYHQVLPGCTLALTVVGPWARQLRASMGDVANSLFVRTARAKGVSEAGVVSRHIMRNALLPWVTMVGMALPTMINTLIALEMIFGLQGMGFELINALDSLLFANATTVALVLAFITVAGNFSADLLYGLIDPRIDYR